MLAKGWQGLPRLQVNLMVKGWLDWYRLVMDSLVGGWPQVGVDLPLHSMHMFACMLGQATSQKAALGWLERRPE